MSSFPRDATILYLGPRAPIRWRTRRYLLWPAWLYRVVAPEVRERQLNVLQKAVLGLCRAGVGTAERIGARLRLHIDLAAQICLELQDKGLIDSRSLPTQEGLDVFEDETLTSHRMVTGHVFQDPTKGDLWPRFLQRIGHAETERDSTGHAHLILGTRGNPRRVRPFMHLPDGAGMPPPPPEPREILRAAGRHRLAVRGAGRLDQRDPEETMGIDAGIALDRISLVDERPTPVFVVTFLYLPEGEGSAEGDWHVCDPFGLGASPRLRQAIEGAFDSSPRLRSVVESMIGSSLADQMEGQRRWAEEIRQKAEIQIDGRLTTAARGLDFHRDLVELASARIEVEILGKDCPQHKLQGLLAAGRRVLEAAFLSIARRHSNHGVWIPLYNGDRPNEDQAFVMNVYDAAAKGVGFALPLPRALRAMKPNQVRAVCLGDGWRLRAAIVAALLTAARDKDHPLHRAARREPKLLAIADRIADDAGGAVHAGNDDLSPAEVFPTIDKVEYIVELLFDMAPSNGARTISRSQ